MATGLVGIGPGARAGWGNGPRGVTRERNRAVAAGGPGAQGGQVRPNTPGPGAQPNAPGSASAVRVDQEGRLASTVMILGIIPYTVTVDPEDLLSGRHGSEANLAFPAPGRMEVAGDLRVHGQSVPRMEVSDGGAGQMLGGLRARLIGDHLVRLDGGARLGPFTVPFEADARADKVRTATYDVTLTNVKAFGWLPLPGFVGAWIAGHVLDGAGVGGVHQAGDSRLRVDLKVALNGKGHVEDFRGDVVELQRRLLASGFDPGPIDGLMGPRTREAMRQYEAGTGTSIEQGLGIRV